MMGIQGEEGERGRLVGGERGLVGSPGSSPLSRTAMGSPSTSSMNAALVLAVSSQRLAVSSQRVPPRPAPKRSPIACGRRGGVHTHGIRGCSCVTQEGKDHVMHFRARTEHLQVHPMREDDDACDQAPGRCHDVTAGRRQACM